MQNKTKSLVRNYLIKQLPSATAFVNTNFEVVDASDKWIDSFDFSTSDVIGSQLFELFGNEGETWRSSLDRCFQGLCGGVVADSYIDNQGEEIHFQWQNIPWFDENENVIGAIIQNEDISQHLADQQELERLEAVLLEKSETANIGSWGMGLDGDIWWCPMTKKIHSVSADFAPSFKSAIDFFKEGNSKEKITKAIKTAREKGEAWSEKLQIVTPCGAEKWVICSGKPLYTNGKFSSLIGTFQDVNEQILQDIKTKESERLLKTLIDHLPINVFIKDINSKKILVNKHELDFYGLKNEDEIIGKDDSHFMDADSAQACLEDDNYVLNTGRPILGKENVIIKDNGEKITFLTSKIPMFGDYGEVIGSVGFSLDISDLKAKEEELRNLINVTSLQNKKLVDFAHIISHNLRSHAANFSMLLEFLLTEKNEAEKNNLTGMLVKASDGLLETLNNLNQVVAITTSTKLNKKPVFLKRAVHNVSNNLADLLLTNKTVLINDIPDDVKVKIVPEYLESILMNFITNGVKYKDPSRDPIITLKTALENNQLVLSIEDNGLGIDLKKHGDKLFGMYKTFHQNEDARGIGLYIAKNQIEAMNGRVVARSKVGTGTKFKIYFNGKI